MRLFDVVTHIIWDLGVYLKGIRIRDGLLIGSAASDRAMNRLTAGFSYGTARI